jgi:flagellar biosynthesis protein FlhA
MAGLAIGITIFAIITLVQFIVITKGATRIAEVAARFTLDALPGRQMAIDADLNAGILTEEQAKARRKDVADEADFFGAMDGASKFVKGDAIAGLVITMVNLLGGLVIGVVQHGMSVGDAVHTYSLLTIGDGLVAQLPALMVSIAAGLIVTRSAGDGDLGSDVFGQLSRQGTALRAAGIVVAAMAIVPGLPKLPFLVFGGAFALAGHRIIKRTVADDAELVDTEPVEVAPTGPNQLVLEARVEPLELDVAGDLIDLVDTSRGGDLLDRIGALRRKLVSEVGFVMPAVRTRDDANLGPSVYVVRIHGVEVGRGIAPPGQVLVLGEELADLPGTDTVEPVFGLPAKWVPEAYRVDAELGGRTVVDRTALVITHIAELVRRRAGRLLSRTDVKTLLEGVEATDPAVTADLAAAGVGPVDVQKVLAALLDDGVPIRDLVRISEAISETARTNKATDVLVGAARQTLGPAISSLLARDGVLEVATVDPLLEHELAGAVHESGEGAVLLLDLATSDRVVSELNRISAKAAQDARQAVVVCSPGLRSALARFTRNVAANVSVLSYREIGDHLTVNVSDSLGLQTGLQTGAGVGVAA